MEDPEERKQQAQKKEYIEGIIILLNLCGDIALLDFILKLLQKSHC